MDLSLPRLNFLLLIVVGLFFFPSLQAQNTYYSQAGGELFSNESNWNTESDGSGSVLGSSVEFTNGINSFVISNGHSITQDINITINNLELDTSSFLTIGNGTGDLVDTINGSIVVRTLATLQTSNNSSDSSELYLAGDLSVAGTSGSDDGIVSFFRGGVTNITTIGGGAVIFSQTAAVTSITLYDLTISHGGSFVHSANVNVRGDFTADGAGTNVISSQRFNFYGDFTVSNDASFLANADLAYFAGSTAQVLTFDSGAVEFAGLYFDNGGSGNIKTINGDLIVDGEFIVYDDAWIESTNRNHIHHGGSLRIRNESLSAPLPFNLQGGSITFDDQTNGRTIYNDLNDNAFQLGNGTEIIIDGYYFIQAGDTVIVDGNVTIKENTTQSNYLVLNGDATGSDESALISSDSTHSLIMETESDLYIRGTDNFPTSFATYSFGQSVFVRYDRDYDQTIRGANFNGDRIDYQNLLTSETNGGSVRKKQMLTGEVLYVAGRLVLQNGSELILTTGTHTFKQNVEINNGSSILGGDSASVIWSVDDANAVWGSTASPSSRFEFKSFFIQNENPSQVLYRYINDTISIADGGIFEIDNTGGDTSSYLVVDLNVYAIEAGNSASPDIAGVADTFLLKENCRLYTSSQNGFVENFGNDADVVTFDSTSLIRFERNDGNYQIIPKASYGSIEFTGSGQRYVEDSLTILGYVADFGNAVFRPSTWYDGGEVDISDSVSHIIKGDWLMSTNGTNASDSGEVRFEGADQLIQGSFLPSVVFGGSGTKNISGTITMNGNVTIQDDVIVDATGRTVNLTGDWIETGGQFTQTTGNVTFEGIGPQTVTQTVASEFGTINLDNSTTLVTNSNVNVAINFNFGSNTTTKLDISGDTLYVARDWYLRDGDSLLTDDISVISFSGNIDQDLFNENDEIQIYPTLLFENSGRKTLQNRETWIVNGDVNISSSSTVTPGENIEVYGNWTNSGLFETTNNYVRFTGDTTHIVSASNFHDFFVGTPNTHTNDTVFLSGNIVLNGDFQIDTNAVLDVTLANNNITVEEDWSNYGSFLSREGKVTFNGSQWTELRLTGLGEKGFYDFIVNKNDNVRVRAENASDYIRGDSIVIANDLTITSGYWRLNMYNSDTTPGIDYFIGGSLLNEGGFIEYVRTENTSRDSSVIYMQGNSTVADTNYIQLGASDAIRDIFFQASPTTTYQFLSDFTMRDNSLWNFTLDSGNIDLNTNNLVLGNGGMLMTGGVLEIDSSATLQIDAGATNYDFSKTGGDLKLIGTSSSPATITNAGSGNYTFEQTGGTFEAQYYTIASSGDSGLVFNGGTLSNMNDGTFTSGAGEAYITLGDIDLAASGDSIIANNVVFNDGPTNNVFVTSNKTSSGANDHMTFVIAGGTLAGESFESDDASATSGFVRWQSPPGYFWTGALSNDWKTLGNWLDENGDPATTLPSATDTIYIDVANVIGGAAGNNTPTIDDATFVGDVAVTRITMAGDVSLILNGATLDINENITIGSDATLTQTGSSDTLYVGGTWSNAGEFNENTATVVFDDSSANTYSITTIDTADAFNNVIFRGTAKYSIGAPMQIKGDIEVLGGTFDNSSGVDLFVRGDWKVSGGTYDPGSGTTYFISGAGDTSDIDGGTFYNLTLSDSSVKNVTNNISLQTMNIIDDEGNKLHGNGNLIFVAGNWNNNVDTVGFSPDSSTVIFNGGTQTISNLTNVQKFHNMTFQGSGEKNVLDSLVVTGSVSIIAENATLDMEIGGDIVGDGEDDFAMTGGNMRIFDESNFPQNFLDYNFTNGTVSYVKGTAGQDIQGDLSYYNLNLRNFDDGLGDVKTLQGDITVQNAMYLRDENVRLDIQGYIITLGNTIIVDDNYDGIDWNGGTLIHNGGSFTLDDDIDTLNNVFFTGTGTKNLDTSLVVLGDWTIDNDITVNVVDNEVVSNGTGSFIMNENAQLRTFVHDTTGCAFPTGFSSYSLDESSIVDLYGATDQKIFTDSGRLVYGILEIYGTGGNVYPDSTLNVEGNFLMNDNRTLSDSGNSFNLNGAIVDLREYDNPTAKITLGRDGDQLLSDNDSESPDPLNLNNLIFTGSGIKTLRPNAGADYIDIDGDVRIDSNVVVDFDRAAQFSGTSWDNNGTFTSTNNATYVFTFDGNSPQIVDPGINNNYYFVTFSNSAVTQIDTNGINIDQDLTVDVGDSVYFGKGITHLIASDDFIINGGWSLDSANFNFDRNGNQFIPSINAQNITISTGGDKVLQGDWTINDLTLESGADLDVNNTSNYNLTVTGNWYNTGGRFFDRNGTVFFEADSSGQTKTINPNGSNFYRVQFNQSLVNTRTSQLLGDMVIEDTLLIGNLATLEVNGNTLRLGNNDGNDPEGEGHYIQDGGTLIVGPGSTLSFSAADDGDDLGVNPNDGVGAYLFVEDGGSFSLVGEEGNIATVTRFDGGDRIKIKAESGSDISLRYYSIGFLADSGFIVTDGATLDSENNFSDGTFSDMIDANRERYYITLESDAADTISNVIFNFDNTINTTYDFNVLRSSNPADNNDTITFINTSGPLGRPGANFEGEYNGATFDANDAKAGVLRWDTVALAIWEGTVSSDFFDPLNWDIGIVPDTSTGLDAEIPIGQPFNPVVTTDSIAVVNNVEITDGVLKIEKGGDLEIGGDFTLGNGTSGTLVQSDDTSTVKVLGSWFASNNSSFSNGNSTVTIEIPLGQTISMTPLELPFYNLTFTNPAGGGEIDVTGANIYVNNNLTVTDNAIVTPSTNNYRIYVSGDVNGSGGTFNTTTAGRIIMDGSSSQTISSIDVNRLQIMNSDTVFINDTVNITSTLEVEDGSKLLFAGHLDIANDVFLQEGGVLLGRDGYDIRFSGQDWFGGAGTYGNKEGEVIFDRAGDQFIQQIGSNPAEFNDLIIAGSNNKYLGRFVSGSWIDGNTNLCGNLTVDSSANAFILYDYSLINTQSSAVDTMFMTGNARIDARGADNFPSNFAVYQLDESSFQYYNGTVDQTIKGEINYGNLVLDNNSTKTLDEGISIQGYMDLNESNLDVSTNNYTINIQGNWLGYQNLDNGSFIGREATVIFDGDADQQIQIGIEGDQDFYNIILNKSAGEVFPNVNDIEIDNNLTVLGGVYDTRGYTTSLGGSLIASSSGTFESGGTDSRSLYYLQSAPGTTPSIQMNGSTIHSMTIDAPNAIYTMVDDLTLNGNFLLDTSTTLNVSSQTITLGNYDDVSEVYGTLNVSTTTNPGGVLQLGNGAQITVKETGILSLVGTATELAKITQHPTNGGRYTLKIDGSSSQPATIQAQFYQIEYMNTGGVFITENGLIDTTNNFSNGSFNNGVAGGTMLRIENTQDLTGSNLIDNVSFPTNPNGGATNVTKSSATSGTIEFDNYSGDFSGEDFDADDNDLITWIVPTNYTWTGIVSNDWYDSRNWDTDLVPDSSSDVIIPEISALVLNEPIITDNANGARANSITLQPNSILKINTSDSKGADLQVEENVTFENTVQLQFLGTDDELYVGGDWENAVSANSLITEGTGLVVLTPTALSNIDNGNNKFYNLKLAGSGTTIIGNDIIVDNDFIIDSGTFDLGTDDITVGEDFVINSGIFNSNNQTVFLNPVSSASKTLNHGGQSFYNLELGDTNSTVEADYALVGGDLTVTNDFVYAKGNLDLGTSNLIFGDDDGNTDNFTLYDTITIGPSSRVIYGSNSSTTVKNGACFNLVGSFESPAILTKQSASTSGYEFTLESGGCMAAQYYVVEYIGQMGINFLSGASLDPTLNFTDGTFSNGTSNGSTGRYLTFNFDNLGASKLDTINNIIFNTGPDLNVVYTTGTTSDDTIFFKNYDGVLGGSEFEQDELAKSDDDGMIRWILEDEWLWVGPIGGGLNNLDWNNPENWNQGTVPDSTSRVLLKSGDTPIIGGFPDPPSTNDSASVLAIILQSGASLTINDDVGFYSNRNTEEEGGSVSNNGTITVNGSSLISIRGSWLNSGTFTAGNSTLSMGSDSGFVSLTTGGDPLNNLIIDDKTPISNMLIQQSDELTINGDFLILDGQFEQLDNIIVNGDWDIRSEGLFTINTGSSIEFNGSTAQTISDSNSLGGQFYSVSFDGVGVKTFASNLTFNNAFSITNNTEVNGGSDSVFIAQTWSNQGVFTPNTSTVKFNASDIQLIDGSGNQNFYNLCINNSALGNSDIIMNTPIDIINELRLAEGIMQSAASSIVTIESGASLVIDETDSDSTNSYITGPMRRIGNVPASFMFPVGKNAIYSPITFNPTGATSATDTIEIEYISSSPQPIFGISSQDTISRVSSIEYWDVDFGANADTSYEVTITWSDAARSGINTLPGLDMAYFNSDSSKWVFLGGTTEGVIAEGAVTSEIDMYSAGPVTFATGNLFEIFNPLPVTFANFTVELISEVVNLRWITSSELNNNYFVIERSQNNITGFDSIGVVYGAGNSSVNLLYTFADYEFEGGTWYYRIRQVDFDGSYGTSEVKSVQGVGNKQESLSDGVLAVYPNPIEDDKLTITYLEESNSVIYSVRLIDDFGKEVLFEEVNNNTITLDNLDQLSNGVYFIQVQTSLGLITKKLLKGL